METDIKPENEDFSIEDKILQLVTEFPQGVSDKVRLYSKLLSIINYYAYSWFPQVLFANMPTVDPRARAQVINKLLVQEKIDLFKGSDGLLYRRREPSKAGTIAGDQEEKIVFKIIESSGNKGVWIRDIRAKSNLTQTQLNKVLKNLETKSLIKSVKSVNATKKKVTC